jgi:GrpB-like predicted nucleotidyltransferase (UPF0157 family)/GNAT superfamily N-acetyltransferase
MTAPLIPDQGKAKSWDWERKWAGRLPAAPPPGQGLAVASVDGEPVGFVHLGEPKVRSRELAEAAFLSALYVLPAHHGQGVGAALLGYAEAMARADGVEDIYLWCLTDNTRAVGFYEVAGYRYDGRRDTNHRHGVPLPRRRFRKSLEPGRGAGTSEGPVLVTPDPTWARRARQLARDVEEAIGEACRGVVHVGSTAVPGLVAKPIYDLDAVVPDDADRDLVRRRLARAGWESQGEKGVAGRESFRDVGRGRPPHHLYVCEASSPELARHRALRERLRADPGLRDAYAAEKCRLAIRHRRDRGAYTEAKGAFIEEVLER